MKPVSTFVLGACLFTGSFASLGNASGADADLPQKARAVLVANCFRCHGQNGSHAGGMNFILDARALLREKKILPGDAAGSELFQRAQQGSMPPKEDDDGKPVPQRPSASDVATLKQWIEAGAPDFSATVAGREFRSPASVLQQIRDDLDKLKGKDRMSARYFTLTNLFNAGVSEEDLETYRGALSKLVNSLSWKKEIVRPQAIDPEKTVYRIDLRDYGWDDQTWKRIVTEFPYGDAQTGPVAADAHAPTDSDLCYVRADWFLYAASRAPLYDAILRLPETDRALEETLLRIDVAKDVGAENVARAAFNGSGVSQNNRLIERHDTDYGAYHKSRDFAGSDGYRNLFAHPLDYQPDGGELIWNLPNGLQAYMLVNAKGQRIDPAPTTIVSDPKQPDRAVHNGVSCMSCHYAGAIEKNDQIRATLEANPNLFSGGDREKILALYPPQAKFSALLHKDALRFQKAVEETGATLGSPDTEPVSASARRFEQDLNLARAAAEAGVKPDDLVAALGRSAKLAEMFGAFRSPGGTVKREVFVAHFSDLVRAVRGGEFTFNAAKQIDRAEALRAKGDLDGALKAYTEALNLNPKNAGALFGRGQCRYRLKQYAECIEDYTAVLLLTPKDTGAFTNRGLAYYYSGDHVKAFADFSSAIDLGSKHATTYRLRGDIYLEREDFKNASIDYARAIEIDANNADAYFGRARCAIPLKDYDSAIADNTIAIRINPKWAAAFNNRGLAYFSNGDHAKAFDDFSSAIDLGTQYAPTYKLRGDIYRERKDYTNAIGDYSRAAELDPKNTDSFFGKAQCHYALKQYAECVEDYNAVIRLTPKNVPAFNNRGLAHFMNGDHDAAFDDFTRAIDLGTDFVPTYLHRGDLYLVRKDYKNATMDYLKALELDPKNADARRKVDEMQRLSQ